MILFAQGVYGEDSGYPWMDQHLTDRLLGANMAKEPKELALLTLIQELGRQTSARYVQVLRGSDSLLIQNHSLN